MKTLVQRVAALEAQISILKAEIEPLKDAIPLPRISLRRGPDSISFIDWPYDDPTPGRRLSFGDPTSMTMIEDD